MKLFFDTEFTGLFKTCRLISIGIVSEDGDKFYAEVDEPFDDVDAWIRENVLEHLLYGTDRWINVADMDTTMVHGSINRIRVELAKWLAQFDTVEFVSDVCHYDFVLLIDIFGTAFDLPKNVCPGCYDINQDIANYYNISQQEAFDMSREYIANLDTGMKHNALSDAIVIKEVYNKINK